MSLDEVLGMLGKLTEEERRAVLGVLRDSHRVPIHRIEEDWNTTAEVILEAIHASPDLTQRGVRGVVAEAIFRTVVAPKFEGWVSIAFEGDQAFDLVLKDGADPITVQVKNQRREKGEPKVDKKLTRMTGSTVYVVETQRTRNGKAKAKDEAEGTEDAGKTRPYRFGEFDLLAVCMHPSTGEWTDFYYCPCHLLLPDPKHPKQLKTLQPIYTDGTNGWTTNFYAAAAAVRAHQAMTKQAAGK